MGEAPAPIKATSVTVEAAVASREGPTCPPQQRQLKGAKKPRQQSRPKRARGKVDRDRKFTERALSEHCSRCATAPQNATAAQEPRAAPHV